MSNRQKKIFVISQYFWPEDFRVNELVHGFKNKGLIVEVLTSIPNYPHGKKNLEFSKNPSMFSSYHGINIHRVFQFLRGKAKLALVLNYLSFVISASYYCLFKLKKKEYDYIFAVQLSPIFSVIPAILCKLMYRKPLYIWILDIWPDSAYSVININCFFKKILQKICIYIYSSANCLFLSSRGFRERLINMGVRQPELVYLPQWVEDVYLCDIEFGGQVDLHVRKKMSSFGSKRIFLFAGNLGQSQDFPNVLLAFKNARTIDQLVFLVLGDGRYKDTICNLIKSYGLTKHVFLLGRYSSDYMPVFYHYAHVLVFSLSDLPIFDLTLPGKVQSYMSSGTPLIGMVNGESSAIIKSAECGSTAASGDVKEFSALIDQYSAKTDEELRVIGNKGRQFSESNFSYETMISRVVDCF